jgi:hypothetical protein
MRYIALNNAKIMIKRITNIAALTRQSQIKKKKNYNLIKIPEEDLLA